MLNEEQILEYTEKVKTMAESALSEDGFTPMVSAWNEDGPFLVVLCENDGETKTPLHVALPMAHMSVVDELVLVLDTLYAEPPNSKDGVPLTHTGEPWYNGYSQIARAENNPDAQYVRDALMVYAFDRLGHEIFQHYPYEVVDGKVVWGEVVKMKTEIASGIYVEKIREVIAQPTLRERLVEESKTSSALAGALEFVRSHPEEAFAHEVAGFVKGICVPLKWPVMIKTGTPEQNLIYSTIDGVTVEKLGED